MRQCPAKEPIILTTEAIAAVFQGFRRERREDLETVRTWIGAVVHGGNWGFDDPEGVAQEVLLKLLRIAREGKVQEPGGFQKFVHTVAKHTSVKVYHRERRRARHETPELPTEPAAAASDPAARLERAEQLELLGHILQQLPEACRHLWNAIYVERRSSSELAHTLGITANNLRVRAHRCLEKARRIHLEASAWSADGQRAGT